MRTFAKRLGSRRLRSGGLRFAGSALGVLGFAVISQFGLELTRQFSTEHPLKRAATHEHRPFTAFQQRAVDYDASKQRVLDAYVHLPLAFIENAGQVDPWVRYYARGPSYGFYFTPEEMVFSFLQRRDEMADKAHVRTVSTSRVFPARQQGITLALHFLGANPHVQLEGKVRAPGHVHYFIGSDPAKWHTGLASYQEVVYRELWPRIDLALRGAAGQFKYEFRVRPGARVEDIWLAYRGAMGLSLDAAGNLQIKTALGVLEDMRPVSYQQVGSRRVVVESRYIVQGVSTRSRYGFALGAGYDPRYPLVIDPGLVYSTFLGEGSFSSEEGTGMAVDAAGNAYVTGLPGPDFPTTPGVYDRTFDNADVFVTKFNPSGSELIYSTFVGPVVSDETLDVGQTLTVDRNGNVFLVGSTIFPDFPTTPGAFDRSFNGGSDAFVLKLNSAGSALIYSTYLGGSSDDMCCSTPGGSLVGPQGRIAVDVEGNVVVTGQTSSDDFPATPGAFDRTINGEPDVFVTKLNATGSALLYSTFLGGSGAELDPAGIHLDGQGRAYLAGFTASSDFPTTPGAFDRTFNGGSDVFVTVIQPSGADLVYSTFIGGTSLDPPSGFTVDSDGHAFVAGATQSDNFPITPGAVDVSRVEIEGFIVKLNPTGSALVYSTFLGGSGDESPIGLALDSEGRAVIAGLTTSADFPVTPDAFQGALAGGLDAFVTLLSGEGDGLVYSTFLGGSKFDFPRAVAADPAGNAYLTGRTFSSDFPTTPSAFDTTFDTGGSEAFVAKLALAPQAVCDGRSATLVGTDANDVLIGTDAADVVAGLGGNDGIRGRGGDDLICGGSGDDVIEGGGGRDVLFGQAGSDLLDGGPSADQLIGDKGDDTLRGQSGPDELYGGTGDDQLDGGSESDFCVGGPDDTADTAVNCEAVQGVP